MESYLIDTNIISELLKGNNAVKISLNKAILTGRELYLSCISYYEIKRGLLASKAIRKMSQFDRLLKRIFKIVYIDKLETLEIASSIYANLRQQGMIINDADILIASLAINHGFILVTNDSDFERIKGLKLENWVRRA